MVFKKQILLTYFLGSRKVVLYINNKWFYFNHRTFISTIFNVLQLKSFTKLVFLPSSRLFCLYLWNFLSLRCHIMWLVDRFIWYHIIIHLNTYILYKCISITNIVFKKSYVKDIIDSRYMYNTRITHESQKAYHKYM